MTEFVARPQKLRIVCWILAGVTVALFSLIATALTGTGEGGGVFSRGDQFAMVGLGLLLASGILLFTRPRVRATETHIHVRNIVGSFSLPWSLVRKVSFDDRSPWMTLELVDDDTVSVLAVQAADKVYAVQAVQKLRAMRDAAQVP